MEQPGIIEDVRGVLPKGITQSHVNGEIGTSATTLKRKIDEFQDAMELVYKVGGDMLEDNEEFVENVKRYRRHMKVLLETLDYMTKLVHSEHKATLCFQVAQSCAEMDGEVGDGENKTKG